MNRYISGEMMQAAYERYEAMKFKIDPIGLIFGGLAVYNSGPGYEVNKNGTTVFINIIPVWELPSSNLISVFRESN